MATHARLVFVGTADSKLEEDLAWYMRIAKLPPFEQQVLLIPNRKFRFDFVFREQRLAVEVDGATYMKAEDGQGGRHNRGAGIESDSEKYCLLAGLGYRLCRVTSKMIKSGRALELIEAALAWTPEMEKAA